MDLQELVPWRWGGVRRLEEDDLASQLPPPLMTDHRVDTEKIWVQAAD